MKTLFTFALSLLFSAGLLAQNTPVIDAPPAFLKLNSFYKKHLSANGIHIISSDKVPDSVLIRAGRIVTFMTNDLPPAVLQQLVKMNTRVGVMACTENTTDIPEHAYLANDKNTDWNQRARGLGGDMDLPLTTCAEENVMAYANDRYRSEDILIHEFAHTIHLVGLSQVDTTFLPALRKLYQDAKSKGLFANTYAISNMEEFWAEGVQDWFNVNTETEKPNGIHNAVNTREELKKYDPEFYDFIHRYFSEFKENPSSHRIVNKYITE